MISGFYILDVVFIAFTIIFVLTAFFRGFVKEIFSLFNWIIALTLSFFLAPLFSDLVGKHYDNKVAIDVGARSVIFILAFILTAMSTSGLRDSMEDKIPKSFNRSLGLLFGFLKTLIIFGFVYSLYLNLYGFLLGKQAAPETMQDPAWIKNAECYSLVKFSGETLDPAVRKFFEEATKNMDKVVPKKLLDEKIDEVIDQKDEALEGLPSQIEKNIPDAGYNKKDIEKMNRLIEIVQ